MKEILFIPIIVFMIFLSIVVAQYGNVGMIIGLSGIGLALFLTFRKIYNNLKK
jgi:hypothetical protein